MMGGLDYGRGCKWKKKLEGSGQGLEGKRMQRRVGLRVPVSRMEAVRFFKHPLEGVWVS